MITDKRILKKAICLILFFIAFVLILSLSSCSLLNTDDYNYDHVFDGIGDLSTNAVTTALNYKYYDVIVPSGCSAEVYEAADMLCKSIELKSQLKADVYYDYELTLRDNGHTFIFVGALDNDICRRAYIDFRSGDYRYSFMNGVFVVGGVSDAATILAIERFTDEVVDRSGDVLEMSDPEGFVYRDEYTDSKEVTLNGFALSQYRLVYPVGDADGMLLANCLRENIEKQFGYTLSVASDAEGDSNSRSICIGRTTRADTYGFVCTETQSVILPYSTGLSIIADSLFGLKDGLDEFFEIISTSDNTDIEIKDIITSEYNVCTGSVLSLCFLEAELDVGEILSVCDTLRKCDADIIRFEGLDYEYFDYIITNLTDIFSYSEAVSKSKGTVFYLYRNGSVTVDTQVLNTECSSLCVFEMGVSRNGLSFTVAELSAGEDADVLGEQVLSKNYDHLIVFGEIGSYDNDFLSSVNTLKRLNVEDLDMSILADNDSVVLKNTVLSKNGIFESSELDFTFFKK